MILNASPFPGILTPPVRTGASGHWAASLSYKAECAWQMVQGITHLVRHRDDAPCPRCGVDLRSPAHDRETLVPFYERSGLDVTAGFRCRVKP